MLDGTSTSYTQLNEPLFVTAGSYGDSYWLVKTGTSTYRIYQIILKERSSCGSGSCDRALGDEFTLTGTPTGMAFFYSNYMLIFTDERIYKFKFGETKFYLEDTSFEVVGKGQSILVQNGILWATSLSGNELLRLSKSESPSSEFIKEISHAAFWVCGDDIENTVYVSNNNSTVTKMDSNWNIKWSRTFTDSAECTNLRAVISNHELGLIFATCSSGYLMSINQIDGTQHQLFSIENVIIDTIFDEPFSYGFYALDQVTGNVIHINVDAATGQMTLGDVVATISDLPTGIIVPAFVTNTVTWKKEFGSLDGVVTRWESIEMHAIENTPGLFSCTAQPSNEENNQLPGYFFDIRGTSPDDIYAMFLEDILPSSKLLTVKCNFVADDTSPSLKYLTVVSEMEPIEGIRVTFTDDVIKTTLPIIWIKYENSNKITKLNSITDDILGTYIIENLVVKDISSDSDGNLWVLACLAAGDGCIIRQVGLNENSQCIDIDNDGKITSSTGSDSVDNDECILSHRDREVIENSSSIVVFRKDERLIAIVSKANSEFYEVALLSDDDIMKITPFTAAGKTSSLIDGIYWSFSGFHLLRYDTSLDYDQVFQVKMGFEPIYSSAITDGYFYVGSSSELNKYKYVDTNTLVGLLNNFIGKVVFEGVLIGAATLYRDGSIIVVSHFKSDTKIRHYYDSTDNTGFTTAFKEYSITGVESTNVFTDAEDNVWILTKSSLNYKLNIYAGSTDKESVLSPSSSSISVSGDKGLHVSIHRNTFSDLDSDAHYMLDWNGNKNINSYKKYASSDGLVSPVPNSNSVSAETISSKGDLSVTFVSTCAQIPCDQITKLVATKMGRFDSNQLLSLKDFSFLTSEEQAVVERFTITVEKSSGSIVEIPVWIIDESLLSGMVSSRSVIDDVIITLFSTPTVATDTTISIISGDDDNLFKGGTDGTIRVNKSSRFDPKVIGSYNLEVSVEVDGFDEAYVLNVEIKTESPPLQPSKPVIIIIDSDTPIDSPIGNLIESEDPDGDSVDFKVIGDASNLLSFGSGLKTSIESYSKSQLLSEAATTNNLELEDIGIQIITTEVFWVPFTSGYGSIVRKVDAITGNVIGKYYIKDLVDFDVDSLGNVWALSSDGALTKIGLSERNACVDLNNDGEIETSIDDTSISVDECILFSTKLGISTARLITLIDDKTAYLNTKTDLFKIEIDEERRLFIKVDSLQLSVYGSGDGFSIFVQNDYFWAIGFGSQGAMPAVLRHTVGTKFVKDSTVTTIEMPASIFRITGNALDDTLFIIASDKANIIKASTAGEEIYSFAPPGCAGYIRKIFSDDINGILYIACGSTGTVVSMRQIDGQYSDTLDLNTSTTSENSQLNIFDIIKNPLVEDELIVFSDDGTSITGFRGFKQISVTSEGIMSIKSPIDGYEIPVYGDSCHYVPNSSTRIWSKSFGSYDSIVESIWNVQWDVTVPGNSEFNCSIQPSNAKDDNLPIVKIINNENLDSTSKIVDVECTFSRDSNGNSPILKSLTIQQTPSETIPSISTSLDVKISNSIYWVVLIEDQDIRKMDSVTNAPLALYSILDGGVIVDMSMESNGSLWVLMCSESDETCFINKIGLLESNQCIDVNLDGEIQTSKDGINVITNDECTTIKWEVPLNMNILTLSEDNTEAWMISLDNRHFKVNLLDGTVNEIIGFPSACSKGDKNLFVEDIYWVVSGDGLLRYNIIEDDPTKAECINDLAHVDIISDSSGGIYTISSNSNLNHYSKDGTSSIVTTLSATPFKLVLLNRDKSLFVGIQLSGGDGYKLERVYDGSIVEDISIGDLSEFHFFVNSEDNIGMIIDDKTAILVIDENGRFESELVDDAAFLLTEIYQVSHVPLPLNTFDLKDGSSYLIQSSFKLPSDTSMECKQLVNNSWTTFDLANENVYHFTPSNSDPLEFECIPICNSSRECSTIEEFIVTERGSYYKNQLLSTTTIDLNESDEWMPTLELFSVIASDSKFDTEVPIRMIPKDNLFGEITKLTKKDDVLVNLFSAEALKGISILNITKGNEVGNFGIEEGNIVVVDPTFDAYSYALEVSMNLELESSEDAIIPVKIEFNSPKLKSTTLELPSHSIMGTSVGDELECISHTCTIELISVDSRLQIVDNQLNVISNEMFENEAKTGFMDIIVKLRTDSTDSVEETVRINITVDKGYEATEADTTPSNVESKILDDGETIEIRISCSGEGFAPYYTTDGNAPSRASAIAAVNTKLKLESNQDSMQVKTICIHEEKTLPETFSAIEKVWERLNEPTVVKDDIIGGLRYTIVCNNGIEDFKYRYMFDNDSSENALDVITSKTKSSGEVIETFNADMKYLHMECFDSNSESFRSHPIIETVSVPVASSTYTQPEFSISGSGVSLEVTVTCPTVGSGSSSSVAYCRFDEMPSFDDVFICSTDAIGVSLSDKTSTTIYSTCAIEGQTMNWENESYFSFKEINKIYEPVKSTPLNIIGGVEIQWVCPSSHDFVCARGDDEISLSTICETTQSFLSPSNEFKAACSNREYIGIVSNENIVVPQSGIADSKPTISLSGASNNVLATVTCPEPHNSDNKSVPFCHINGLPTLIVDDNCSDGIIASPGDNLKITVHAICATEGQSIDLSDNTLFAQQDVHKIYNPLLDTTHIVGGVDFQFKCTAYVGEAVCVLGKDTELTVDDKCPESNILFERTYVKRACTYQGLLGQIIEGDISVYMATEGECTPSDTIIESTPEMTIVKPTCKDSAVAYCNMRSNPSLEDTFVCPENGFDVTPVNHNIPEGESADLRLICVPVGKFVDFDDDALFTTVDIKHLKQPQEVSQDLVGSKELFWKCDGDSIVPKCKYDGSSGFEVCDSDNKLRFEDSTDVEVYCEGSEFKSSKHVFKVEIPDATESDLRPRNIITKPILGGVEIQEIVCASSTDIPRYNLASPPQTTDDAFSIISLVNLDPSKSNKPVFGYFACFPLGKKLPVSNTWTAKYTIQTANSPSFIIDNSELTVKMECNGGSEIEPYLSNESPIVLTDETNMKDKTQHFDSLLHAEGFNGVCVGEGIGISEVSPLVLEGEAPTDISISNTWLFYNQPNESFVAKMICDDDKEGTHMSIEENDSFFSIKDGSSDGEFNLYIQTSVPEDVNIVEATFRCVDSINLFMKKVITFNVHRPPKFIFNESSLKANVDENGEKMSLITNVELMDIESLATFSCEMLEFSVPDSTNPFDIRVSDVKAGNDDSTMGTLEVLLKHPSSLNAVITSNFNFKIQCKDEFDLKSNELLVEITVLDKIAPEIIWKNTPPFATMSEETTFSFDVFDGGINCITCTFTCALNSQAITSDLCKSPTTLSNIPENENVFTVTVSDGYQYEDFSSTWYRVNVTVVPFIRSEQLSEKEFTPGVDKIIVSEFAAKKDMLEKLIDTHVDSMDIGLKLSPKAKNDEIVVINCEALGDIVEISPSTLRFNRANSDIIQWMTISGLDDYDNNPDMIPFSVKCDVSSNDKFHFDMSPSFEFEGNRQSVIWPIFEDILWHYQETSDSNRTLIAKSIDEDGQFSFTAAGDEIVTIMPHKGYLESYDPVFLDEMSIAIDGTELPRLCTDLSSDDSECIIESDTGNIIIDFDPSGIVVQFPNIDDDEYHPLELRNPYDIKAVDSKTPYQDAVGGIMSCPPYCGKATEGRGIYFTEKCVGYTNGAECRDPKVSQEKCAVRVAGRCKPCSDFQGSICPGGNRMWPMTEYWSTSESLEPSKCPTPSDERCLGWNEGIGASVCGEIYTGPLCANCIQGYYPGFNDLSCEVCPETTIWNFLTPLLVVLTLATSVFLIMLALVWYANRTRGGSMAGGAKRTLSFVIWTVMAVQTIIQVGRSAKDHLPQSLQTFYTVLNIFQFEVDLIHPNCMGDDPLFIDKLILSSAFIFFITMLTIAIVLRKKSPRLYQVINGTKSVSEIPNKMVLLTKIQKALHLISGLIYPVICNSCLKLMDCVDIHGEIRLRQNTSLVCYEDDVLFLNIGAWVLFFSVLIGMPLFTFFWLKDEVKKMTANSKNPKEELDYNLNADRFKLTTSWAYFLSNDFRANTFYFRHFNQLTLLLITIAMSFGINSFLTAIIDVSIFTVGIVYYISEQPFIPIEKWKTPVKASILLLSILAATFNFAAAQNGFGEDTMEFLAYLLLFASLLVLTALIISFIYVLFSGAKLEALVERRAKKKHLKRMRSSGSNNNDELWNNDGKNGSVLVENPMLEMLGGKRQIRHLNPVAHNNKQMDGTPENDGSNLIKVKNWENNKLLLPKFQRMDIDLGRRTDSLIHKDIIYSSPNGKDAVSKNPAFSI
eukprot:TRINITY_DN3676_c1_g1_i1.p1 TRINITY_DN3676_c1_g1~~TRINITY_DN3676_c1_g1_i1.p1  ORF type:complete len:5010 (-),score=1308.71 TRINITY_DN3676_c1_g1_i1:429-13310(-)